MALYKFRIIIIIIISENTENSVKVDRLLDSDRVGSRPIYRVVQKTDTLCFVRLNFIKY